MQPLVIEDAVFPEFDCLRVEQSADKARFILSAFVAGPALGSSHTMIALDVDGALQLAKSLANFLRQQGR